MARYSIWKWTKSPVLTEGGFPLRYSLTSQANYVFLSQSTWEFCTKTISLLFMNRQFSVTLANAPRCCFSSTFVWLQGLATTKTVWSCNHKRRSRLVIYKFTRYFQSWQIIIYALMSDPRAILRCSPAASTDAAIPIAAKNIMFAPLKYSCATRLILNLY